MVFLFVLHLCFALGQLEVTVGPDSRCFGIVAPAATISSGGGDNCTTAATQDFEDGMVRISTILTLSVVSDLVIFCPFFYCLFSAYTF